MYNLALKNNLISLVRRDIIIPEYSVCLTFGIEDGRIHKNVKSSLTRSLSVNILFCAHFNVVIM